MPEPLLIYADPYGHEVDTIGKFKGDFIVGGDRNDFSLDIPASIGVAKDWYLMLDGTEFGGIVDGLEIDTSRKFVTATGRTWQGMLQGTVIVPDSEQSHLVLNGDLNTIIGALIERQGFSDRMAAPDTPSGFMVANYRIRNRYGYEAICEMCASVGAKLMFRYDGSIRKCLVYATARGDYVDDGIDGDSVRFKIRDQRLTNHWLGLGKGEGAARIAVNGYADAQGNKSLKQVLFGVRHIMEIYDSPSAEKEDLEEAIEKRRKETQKKLLTCSLKDATSGDYDIGDIVGGRSTQHKISVVTEIAQKTAKVTPQGIVCTTKTALEVS